LLLRSRALLSSSKANDTNGDENKLPHSNSPVRDSCTWLIAGQALDNYAARKIYLRYYACVHEQRLNNSLFEPRSINFFDPSFGG
jgi:hypothetical protein